MDKFYGKLWIIEIAVFLIFLITGLIFNKPKENIIALLCISLMAGGFYLAGFWKNKGGATIWSLALLIFGIIILFTNIKK